MATGNTLVPLTLELIEEGQFQVDLRAAIAKAQAALIEHIETWGERAGKAKAKVEMAITFECHSIEDAAFVIVPELKLKLPSRPPRPTMAMAGFDRKADQAVLFVRDTGSTKGDPTQYHLPLGQESEANTEKSEA